MAHDKSTRPSINAPTSDKLLDSARRGRILERKAAFLRCGMVQGLHTFTAPPRCKTPGVTYTGLRRRAAWPTRAATRGSTATTRARRVLPYGSSARSELLEKHF